MDKMKPADHYPLPTSFKSGFTMEGALRQYSTRNLHCHSCHQFLRIRKGLTLLVETGKKQPLFSNMTAFIPAGQPHRSVVMGDDVTYKSIYLDVERFHTTKKEIVIFDMSRLGVALFDRIDLPGEPGAGQAFHLQCLDLLLVLLKTEITRKSDIARIPVPTNPLIQTLTRFIEENFHRKLTLSDLTGMVHYSKRHISRLFKEDLKLSPFEYIRLYRIFSASILLSDPKSSKTITDIAFSCGYESLSSFYKDFKQIFSITPKQFRSSRKKSRN